MLLVGVGPFFSSNHQKTTAADSPNYGSQAFAILTIHTPQDSSMVNPTDHGCAWFAQKDQIATDEQLH